MGRAVQMNYVQESRRCRVQQGEHTHTHTYKRAATACMRAPPHTKDSSRLSFSKVPFIHAPHPLQPPFFKVLKIFIGIHSHDSIQLYIYTCAKGESEALDQRMAYKYAAGCSSIMSLSLLSTPILQHSKNSYIELGNTSWCHCAVVAK